MKLLEPRVWFSIVFLSTAALLGYAYYEQYVQFLNPCPLCILQRVAFFTMGLFALIAVLHNPRGIVRIVYGGFIILAGIAGMLIAGRHVWLQSLPPDKVPDCGPSLGYMLQSFPLAEVWQTVLHGSGSCAEVDWQFIGLSMPAWTLVWYVVLTAGTLWVLVRQRGT